MAAECEIFILNTKTTKQPPEVDQLRLRHSWTKTYWLLCLIEFYIFIFILNAKNPSHSRWHCNLIFLVSGSVKLCTVWYFLSVSCSALSSLPSHRNVSYEDLLGVLQRYGVCQQRLGQWCAGRRQGLHTGTNVVFIQSDERWGQVVIARYLAVSLMTSPPGSLTD